MAFCFIGKKVLITGAGSGLGRELSKAISKTGGVVYALGRNKKNLESLATECDNVRPIIQDLSDWQGTKEALGRLETMDCVVNNAVVHHVQGVGLMDSIDVTEKMLDEAFRVNLLAPINVIQATCKKMISAGKPGSVVNVSSTVSLQPLKKFMWYNASKAGLDMVTKQFALELAPHQIRVNSVNPTYILVDWVKEFFSTQPELLEAFQSQISLGRFCEPRDVTDPIMYYLSEHSSMVTGTINLIDGGLMSKTPV